MGRLGAKVAELGGWAHTYATGAHLRRYTSAPAGKALRVSARDRTCTRTPHWRESATSPECPGTALLSLPTAKQLVEGAPAKQLERLNSSYPTYTLCPSLRIGLMTPLWESQLSRRNLSLLDHWRLTRWASLSNRSGVTITLRRGHLWPEPQHAS